VAVLECELSASFSTCGASVEFGCEANFIDWIPGGKAATKALEYVGAEAAVGVGGNIAMDICAAKGGGVAAKSAQACLSGFVRVGWNVPKKKSEIP
jgi:hypothetical protein